MPNTAIIFPTDGRSGVPTVFRVFNAAGQVFRAASAAFVAFSAAQAAAGDYDQAATEIGGSGASGIYSGTMPAAIAAAGYYYSQASQAGQLVSDRADYWDGTQFPAAVPLPATPPAGYGATVFAGAYAVTVHVTDGTVALGSALVRLTQGSVTQTLATDASGNAAFSLDAGAYTLTVTKGGYSYSPTTQTVAGAGTINAVMSASSSPVAGPGQTTATLTLLGPDGLGVSGAVLEYRVDTGDGVAGRSYDRDVHAATSPAGGVVNLLLAQATAYKFRRVGATGSGDWVSYTTPATATCTLPQVLAREQN